MERYPHQLSGGLLQRAAIATALSCGPELVIADEPTTALDALVQVQVIESFRRLVRELGTSLLVITHDLRLLERMADRIAAMYAGRIVEFGPSRRLLDGAAAPLPCGAPGVVRPGRRAGPARCPTIDGQPPALPGTFAPCAFAPRCPRADERCCSEVPALSVAGRPRARPATTPSSQSRARRRHAGTRGRQRDRPGARPRRAHARSRSPGACASASACSWSWPSSSSLGPHRLVGRPHLRNRSKASARSASRSTLGAAGHPLGTDPKGRDLLARILLGGRLTLRHGAARGRHRHHRRAARRPAGGRSQPQRGGGAHALHRPRPGHPGPAAGGGHRHDPGTRRALARRRPGGGLLGAHRPRHLRPGGRAARARVRGGRARPGRHAR